MNAVQPLVSVLLPTYNRAAFLEAALDAIRTQTWTAWELIVVDDGSTDATASVIESAKAVTRQPILYVKQDNAGAYGARNTALDHASGKYVAFYDSDDLWLPHHLRDCVEALEANPDIDWVYGSCRSVDYETGRTIAPDTFRAEGRERPFMKHVAEVRGKLHVLATQGLFECALLSGLYAGLQNSVMKRTLFDGVRFEAELRNEAEDQLFVARGIKRGYRFAFLDNVHVQYHVHGSNSSGSASGMTLERWQRLLDPVARGFERLRQDFQLTSAETRALRRRLHREYFWHQGYSVFLANGRYSEAVTVLRRGLREWPWSARAWKSYVVARLRMLSGARA
ncbi:MAG: glycosyltransferase family A protein [Vicinamibacterales bacterium]